jgi:hypothetical protein
VRVPRTTPTLRLRRPAAIAVAAMVALIGATPLLAYGWYYAPVLLVPFAVGLWAWRSGTDVDAGGLRIRAAVGSRRVPWTEIAELAPTADGRVAARLGSGAVLRLPAVTPQDLPQLVRASGQELFTDPP